MTMRGAGWTALPGTRWPSHACKSHDFGYSHHRILADPDDRTVATSAYTTLKLN